MCSSRTPFTAAWFRMPSLSRFKNSGAANSVKSAGKMPGYFLTAGDVWPGNGRKLVPRAQVLNSVHDELAAVGSRSEFTAVYGPGKVRLVPEDSLHSGLPVFCAPFEPQSPWCSVPCETPAGYSAGTATPFHASVFLACFRFATSCCSPSRSIRSTFLGTWLAHGVFSGFDPPLPAHKTVIAQAHLFNQCDLRDRICATQSIHLLYHLFDPFIFFWLRPFLPAIASDGPGP